MGGVAQQRGGLQRGSRGALLRFPNARRLDSLAKWGLPKIRGTRFRGPHNKDYSILGSILGSLVLGNCQFARVPFFYAIRSSTTKL